MGPRRPSLQQSVTRSGTMQQELDAGKAPSGMHLSDSAAPSSPVCFSLLALLIACMHKTRQIWPIAGLAGGWIAPTRIVRRMLLIHINLLRYRNLPRRRLSSRAERCQKPKPAPDDEPFGSAGPYLTCLTPCAIMPERADIFGSGLAVIWEAHRGAAACLIWRCRIWTNGA